MPPDTNPTQVSPHPPVFVLGPGDVAPAAAAALFEDAVVGDADLVTLDVSGPAAIQCLQGILTNDVEAAGHHGFLYGAVLTPKGMIVSDLWIARDGGKFTLFAPAQGREPLLAVLTRSLPPRLARPMDRSGDAAVLRLAGPRAVPQAERAGLTVPRPGGAARGRLGELEYQIGRPARDRPFALQVTCPADGARTVRRALEAAGAMPVPGQVLELARIIAGWPRLGAEIDDKTLPQEARFDALEGVSYTKGCYTGQETVARLHFRGHTNKEVTGLLWDQRPNPEQPAIRHGDRGVGRVSSVAWVERVQRFVGLGIVRTSVELGEVVTAGAAAARTVELPFRFDG